MRIQADGKITRWRSFWAFAQKILISAAATCCTIKRAGPLRLAHQRESTAKKLQFTARLQMMSNQHLKEKLAESARYALLRRLAPVLRHYVAGSLQPLSMMAILLEKRLQIPSPDLAALARNSSQLNTAARDASSACMTGDLARTQHKRVGNSRGRCQRCYRPGHDRAWF